MKRKIFGLFALAAMLLATSCSEDLPEMSTTGDENSVSFSVGIENAVNSRVISDGSGANTLVYQVYDADGNALSSFSRVQLDNVTFPYELTLRLVKGQTYKIAFWAQNSNTTVYNTADLKAVTVDYTGDNNDETRDAFYSVETFTVSGQTLSSTLRRPFAQINLGATEEDYEASLKLGFEIQTSKVVINNAPNTLNLLTGEASGEATVAYNFATIPALVKVGDDPEAYETLTVNVKNPETGKIEPETYAYMSMSYILASADKATLDQVAFTLKTADDKEIFIMQGLTNVPVQRNWRTNILGSFITTEQKWVIVIDPEYSGDYTSPDFKTIADGVSYDPAAGDEAKPTFYISNKAGLTWLTNTVKGSDANVKDAEGNDVTYGAKNTVVKKTFANTVVKLTQDIDLGNESWDPIGGVNGDFNGTFDGGNHTIYNLKVAREGLNYGGLFGSVTTAGGTIKNVKIFNADVKAYGHAGALVGRIYGPVENCHVTNANIVVVPIDKSGSYDEGNDVGALIGMIGECTTHVSDCSVENATVRGFRHVGGIVGKFMGMKSPEENTFIKNCTVSNTNIVGDWSKKYGTEASYADTYGALIGVTGYNYYAVGKNDQTNADRFKNLVPTTQEDSANTDNNYVNNVTITVLDPEASEWTVPDLSYIEEAVAAGVTEIKLVPGTYDAFKYNTKTAFTATDVTIDAQGAEFKGAANQLSFDGTTTIKNAIFNNTTSTGNRFLAGNFVDCVFKGDSGDGLYNYYLHSDVTFTRCKFIATKEGCRALHLGENPAKASFENCEFEGYSPINGQVELTFTECKFSTNAAKEGGLGLRGTSVLTGCELNITGEVKDHNEIALKVATASYTFTNCTTNGEALTKDYDFTVDVDNTPVTIDGEQYTLAKKTRD
ncbi:MAG: hypothetical protein J1F05_03540 [Muribaculaceae bacterium]|nr:hypothetical protein [Muribaculaceae bacterium]